MQFHSFFKRFHRRTIWLCLGLVLVVGLIGTMHFYFGRGASQRPKSAEQMAREGNSPIPWTDMEDAQQILIDNVRVEMSTDDKGQAVPIVLFDLNNQSDVSLTSVSLGFEHVPSLPIPTNITGDGFVGLDPPIAPGESQTLRTRVWSKQRDYGFPLTLKEASKGHRLRMEVTHIVGGRTGKGVVFRNLRALTSYVQLDAYLPMNQHAP